MLKKEACPSCAQKTRQCLSFPTQATVHNQTETNMIPRKLLGSAQTPDKAGELQLSQRGDDFFIAYNGKELMNSRMHGSEDQLAEFACKPVAGRPEARVLVGGLGLGYTLAATLAIVKKDAAVVVAELVPAVVQWNRTICGHLAGHPLDDPRVQVQEEDVCLVLKNEESGFDAVMLDVDNSPDSMTQKSNDWLYTKNGLLKIYRALRPQGILSVWSAAPDRTFTRRLQRAGFTVQEKTVSARGSGKGGLHTLWVARRQLT
jgi:spermidine synthase